MLFMSKINKISLYDYYLVPITIHIERACEKHHLPQGGWCDHYFVPKKLVIGLSPALSLLICVKYLSNNIVFALSLQYFSFFFAKTSISGYSAAKAASSARCFLIALILSWYFQISSSANPKN